jgi:hypothetical protein
MTSIDGAQIGDLLGHEVSAPFDGSVTARPATERRVRPMARKIAGGFGLLVLTGLFLAATVAAVPVTAVYSFIWIAKI